MDRKVVTILLDIWDGPIWGCTYDEKTGKYDYEIRKIDEDKKLMSLHQQIQDLYSSYYTFTDKEVITHEEQEKKDKDKMLSLLGKLKDRLNEINDGSFVIDDRETELVKKL
ncbi:MAG: RNA helicase [Aerococcus sp.]|nr:RNA helicase [Aerococcus sp.]